ncbi:hypothetical protein C6376_43395 [Streptomyces sp. P3]|nr:hypothetical protein C6376_43395 [Streptomyces sp. P3]
MEARRGAGSGQLGNSTAGSPRPGPPVGGLAAAVGLRRIGWEVTLVERASTLEDAGAGIWRPTASAAKCAATSSQPTPARSAAARRCCAPSSTTDITTSVWTCTADGR